MLRRQDSCHWLDAESGTWMPVELHPAGVSDIPGFEAVDGRTTGANMFGNRQMKGARRCSTPAANAIAEGDYTSCPVEEVS